MMNKTHLDPRIEKRVHRDYLAHCFRWQHLLKFINIQSKILDLGCGAGIFYEVLYRSRFNPQFTGIDIRQKLIEKNKKVFPKATWRVADLTKKLNDDVDDSWDIIVCFEMLEHCGKQHADMILKNIKRLCRQNTLVFISTPCYDAKVGAAKNHTFDSGDGRGVAVQEFTYREIKKKIEKYFTVEKVYGTFASQKDYLSKLKPWQRKMFKKLNGYFNPDVLSTIMAPFFPTYARNCIWRCKIK